jgi:glycerol-3-phosphate acyltransferase PlsY
MHFVGVVWIIWAGFFLILGNSFPCFHGFRGGKGVANYLGFTLPAAPWAALASAIAWLSVYGVKRTPFIASLFMAAILSAGHAWVAHWALPASAGALATFALIFFNHRSNIMQYGKEPPPGPDLR